MDEEPKLSATDQRWIDALNLHLGGGGIPIWLLPDGSVNAERTIASFCSLKGWHSGKP